MYEQQRQDLNDLCLAVIHEKHPNKLTELMAALNVLLERDRGRRKTRSEQGRRSMKRSRAWSV